MIHWPGPEFVGIDRSVHDGGGQLVAEYSTALASTQQVSYLTTDHLGSPRVITNENGAVVSRKDFMAFGDQASSAQRVSGSTGNGYDPASTREDYTGYEKDTESGLEFAQARYYNPTHGRYTSIDPMTASASIKNPQTFNRYSYVLNSPYKFVDPLGLISQTTGACGSDCLGSRGGAWGSGAMTAGGFETPFETSFAAMALIQQVSTALTALAAASFDTVFSRRVSIIQRAMMKNGLKAILENGNDAARKIAATLINTSVTLDVASSEAIGASGSCGYTGNAGITNDWLQSGVLSTELAMSNITITIASEEFTNIVSAQAAVETNLLHEGSHAMAKASVLHSMAVSKNTWEVLDISGYNDEVAAKRMGAQYALDRGGVYVTHGIAAQTITADGKLNEKYFSEMANGDRGNTVMGYFKGLGIHK